MARKRVAALLVDVLVDAGVERAYGSLEFRELPAFCGMVGKLISGKNSALEHVTAAVFPSSLLPHRCQVMKLAGLFSGDSSGPSLRAM